MSAQGDALGIEGHKTIKGPTGRCYPASICRAAPVGLVRVNDNRSQGVALG